MTAKISEEHTDLMKSRISLNKFGSPDDVANTIAFLSSNMSDYIIKRQYTLMGVF